MNPDPQPMKIADLERVSGVHRSTIHHYLNLGLLPRPRVAGPKLHLFGPDHVARLDAIQALRSKGWSLPRIREHLTRVVPRRRSKASAGGEADGTRGLIVEHATRLFAERGYHGVRLTDVARALGLGKATLYRYFPSKQALFVDCVERVRFTLIPREVRDDLEQQTSFTDQGRRRALGVLRHFADYRTLNHLLGSLVHGPDPELASRARTELHSMITNAEPFLRALMREGLVRRSDSELLAYMIWGALMGAGERLTLDGKYTIDQVLEAYLTFAAAGMAAAPVPA